MAYRRPRLALLVGLALGQPAWAPLAPAQAAGKPPAHAVCAPFLQAGRDRLGPERWGMPPRMVLNQTRTYAVTVTTSLGAIGITLLPRLAPLAVNNFLFLTCQGFYDNLTFHRVIKGFVIQGGDPLGNGTGGPGYTFADERVTTRYTLGTLAMANAGPNTNGSQFFIVQGVQGTTLPPRYTIFGQVRSGMGVVDAIASVPVRATSYGESSSPITPVRIKRITIQES